MDNPDISVSEDDPQKQIRKLERLLEDARRENNELRAQVSQAASERIVLAALLSDAGRSPPPPSFPSSVKSDMREYTGPIRTVSRAAK